MFFSKKAVVDASVNALFAAPTPMIKNDFESPADTIDENGVVTPGQSLSSQLMAKTAPTRDARRPRHKAEENIQIEKDKKSLFVGNVPVTIQADKKLLKEFKTLFSQFGKIESIRFRSIVSNFNLSINPRRLLNL